METEEESSELGEWRGRRRVASGGEWGWGAGEWGEALLIRGRVVRMLGIRKLGKTERRAAYVHNRQDVIQL